ncbi:MAG: hypothetical protein ACR2NR_00990 [Solirubrobacteraceae bacterium]
MIASAADTVSSRRGCTLATSSRLAVFAIGWQMLGVLRAEYVADFSLAFAQTDRLQYVSIAPVRGPDVSDRRNRRVPALTLRRGSLRSYPPVSPVATSRFLLTPPGWRASAFS